MNIRKQPVKRWFYFDMRRALALMFAVKDSDTIEHPSGEKAVGRNRPELRRAGSGARDDG